MPNTFFPTPSKLMFYGLGYS